MPLFIHDTIIVPAVDFLFSGAGVFTTVKTVAGLKASSFEASSLDPFSLEAAFLPGVWFWRTKFVSMRLVEKTIGTNVAFFTPP